MKLSFLAGMLPLISPRAIMNLREMEAIEARLRAIGANDEIVRDIRDRAAKDAEQSTSRGFLEILDRDARTWIQANCVLDEDLLIYDFIRVYQERAYTSRDIIEAGCHLRQIFASGVMHIEEYRVLTETAPMFLLHWIRTAGLTTVSLRKRVADRRVFADEVRGAVEVFIENRFYPA